MRGWFGVMLTLAVAFAASSGMAAMPNPNRPPFNLANVPQTDYDPVMDGRATELEEWEHATRLPDSFFFGTAPRSGFYYFEARLNWTATSVRTGATDTYPGTTTFVAHDIVGSSDPNNPLHQFQVDDDNDWNSFEFPISLGKVTIWVFDDEDDLDDSDWLPFAEGLATSSLIPAGAGANQIDDRGFIVRLNDDPTTDRQWFEGMPEPGDAGWDWAFWYYAFGRHTFGQSFQDVGLDTDPENRVDHEVYEFCSYRPDWVSPPPPPPPPPPWCIWWDTTTVTEIKEKTVIVIKDGRPVKAKVKVKVNKKVPILRGQFWLHYWDPELFPLGNPDTFQQVQFIRNALLTALEAAPNDPARNSIQFALTHLQRAHDALLAHDTRELFRNLNFVFKFLRKTKRLGTDPLLIIDPEMQILSLFSTAAAQRIMALDASLPMEDKVLRNAYKALYNFGTRAAKLGAQGGKGNPAGAAKWLKVIFTTVEKGETILRLGTVQKGESLLK